jgi:CRISPR/Cas system-associated protein Cas10 (large subunit of type III CRISPR-Cas system)
MQSPIPILVVDALPVRKGVGSSSEDSADGFEVDFDPNYSEYDLMANRKYKETKYSQELKLSTSPVYNVFMPYCYHMESYKTLINYAQTYPKENEYLKEVMKDSIAKMVKFTTESGMVKSAAVVDIKITHPQSNTGFPMSWVFH